MLISSTPIYEKKNCGNNARKKGATIFISFPLLFGKPLISHVNYIKKVLHFLHKQHLKKIYQNALGNYGVHGKYGVHGNRFNSWLHWKFI